ncbi:hypothetical protein E2C01_059812 [Portunus trituberculatus]|uniref:Uncharacterized protein n=1 Tax=Portunus trituberculatus TaxID=210409 RepID=A0A5B7HAB3_PORTR|nr:hypothetical protein [Portunus trituberculatus]
MKRRLIHQKNRKAHSNIDGWRRKTPKPNDILLRAARSIVYRRWWAALVAEVASAREPGGCCRGCSRLHGARACKDALLANGGGSVTVGRVGMGPSVSAISSGVGGWGLGD